jgi:hypothetical protein
MGKAAATAIPSRAKRKEAAITIARIFLFTDTFIPPLI